MNKYRQNNPNNITGLLLVLLIIGSLLVLSIKVEAQKVKICHIPPGNTENAHNIIIDKSALAAHFDHGDYMGVCKEREGDNYRLRIAPNPYQEKTFIEYRLAEETWVKMEVFDQIGNKVKTLVEENQVAGEYIYEFSAKGICYSPGLHILRVSTKSNGVISVIYKRLMELH